MKYKNSILLLLVTLLCVTVTAQDTKPANIETIILKNNDRVSGEITKFEDDKVFLKTEYLEEVKIAWASIKGIESTRTLYLRMQNGNILAAQVNGVNESGQWVLNSPLLGRIQVAADQVVMVGLNEEQVHPDFLKTQKELKEKTEALEKATKIEHIWSGYIDLSFSGNEGNKNDTTLFGKAHVERVGPSDTFIAEAFVRHANVDDDLIANEAEGFLKELVNVSERFYIFGQLGARWDEVNNLELRFDAQLGLGWQILKAGDLEIFSPAEDGTHDTINMSFEFGAAFTSTDFDDNDTADDQQTGGSISRLLYQQVFPNKWQFNFVGEYFQGLNETDDYRLRGEAVLIIPISGALSFTGRVINQYTNIVDDNVERNDFDWFFGLRITF